MRWLSRVRANVLSRLGNESGVTIIFIAVVLLALLAMTAFVIDFGRIWQERRELQAGATAAAFALGEDCARDLCDAAYDEMFVADLYADANATDGAAGIHSVTLDLTGQTVEVVTATKETDGADSMDMLFARIVGFDTITVGAGATVAWGTPYDASTMPLIFSECEWLRGEPDWPGWPGGDEDSLPDYDDQNLDLLNDHTMVTIMFHASQNDDTGCTLHPGLDLPGGWGWLDTDTGCTTNVTVDDRVGVDPGNRPPSECDDTDFDNMLGDPPILIPFYREQFGNGNNAEYEVSGYAAFFVTGFRFIGHDGFLPPYLSARPCGPPDTCLSGYFVQYTSNAGTGGDIGAEDRGVTVIQLIA